MKSLYEIAQIVAIQKGENNERNIAKYISFGKAAFRERNIVSPIGIQSEKFDIEKDTYSIKLPDGFVKETQVGICVNGYIIQFDYDKSTCNFPKVENFCNEENGIVTDDDAEEHLFDCCNHISSGCLPSNYHSYFDWGPCWYGGQEIKSTLGIPAYRGKHFYKIENGRLWLSGCRFLPDQVVLKYKTNGLKVGEKTLIPELYEQSIVDYMHWKEALLKSRPNTGALREEYRRQCDIIRMTHAKTNIIEIVRTIRSATGIGILKR